MAPKEYREKTGETQLQAALDFGVTPTTWYRWERAGRFPKPILQLANLKLASCKKTLDK